MGSKTKRCVVTGGAGFIGSHLVERLVTEGHTVCVLDNLSTGREENLAAYTDTGQVSLHPVDVAELAPDSPLFQDVDWVFHLAALADIVPSIQHPMAYHRANVDGTFAVLEAARAANVKRFIYAASSSCYGLAKQLPTPEDATMAPMYPYALTKYVGEQYVSHWQQTYQLPCVSLRFFNVYGPRSRTVGAYGAVFGVFLAQKFAGLPYTVVGDGEQRRDFTYVTDVVAALIRAAESSIEGEVFNVGSGDSVSINTLVKLLGGAVTYLPKRPGEPDCTFADIAKIERMLGWSPKVKLAQGVTEMLSHLHLWRDAPVWRPESIAEATRDWFKYLG